MGHTVTTQRVAALVGPYTSGKTSLLEAMLMRADVIHRLGKVTEGTTVGDGSPEARDRQMGVEVNVARADYMDQAWTFLDCPGSVEFMQDTYNALMVADIAVVVVDPEPERAAMLTPVLKFLDSREIPHLIFINKVDHAHISVRAVLEGLQAVSSRPLVLREVPIREGEEITGYVDLISERAYKYRQGEASQLVQLPDSVREREAEARQEMLESLADFNDDLLEKLLEDTVPPAEEIYADLARDIAGDLVVPVLFGSATNLEGVGRLLKSLRHDTPDHTHTATRQGLDPDGPPLARCFKTLHAQHTGKLSLIRLFAGQMKDNATVDGDRPSGMFTVLGSENTKVAGARAGEVVALGRMEKLPTGALIENGRQKADADWPKPMSPVYALAVQAVSASDDVKLTQALSRLCEDDPSLGVEQREETNQLVLWGQGDIHLKVAVERLKSQYNLEIATAAPKVPFQETIRKSTKQQGRFKRQSGGHGQFGDVHIEIRPLPRGEGVAFSDSITGGVVPKAYIPAVEAGVKEYARQGVLGFPVVDFAVSLYDGSYHTVDSSEQAFKTAAQLALREGMPKCDPVLLEPILMVEVSVPADATSRAQRALSSRRGQILAFSPKEGWEGWDIVQAHVPQAEIADLITDLRSQSMGVGTYTFRFDHMQELSGKQADQIVAARAAELKG